MVKLKTYIVDNSNKNDTAQPTVNKTAPATPTPEIPTAPAPTTKNKATPRQTPMIAPTETEPNMAPKPLDTTMNIKQPSTPTPTPTAHASEQDKPSTLTKETRLITTARRQLHNKSTRNTLVPLTKHTKHFTKNQLTKDHMALTTRTHCEADNTATNLTKTKTLSQTFPTSSHLSHVERTCEEN